MTHRDHGLTERRQTEAAQEADIQRMKDRDAEIEERLEAEREAFDAEIRKRMTPYRPNDDDRDAALDFQRERDMEEDTRDYYRERGEWI